MEENSNQITVQWKELSRETSHGMCALLQQRSLVDVVITCGTIMMEAHKCVLAAHSNYLKNQFETKPVDQILFNGVDLPVVKSLIEFIYYGETKMNEIHLKHFFSLMKLLEIPSLKAVFTQDEFKPYLDDNITIPLPQFIYDPSKYPELIHITTYTNLEVVNFLELPSTSTEIFDSEPIILDYNEILTIDKLNNLLNNKDVEILFQTCDGINIDVRNKVDVMNLAPLGLQYAILDKTGKFGQVHELRLTHQENQTNDDNEENINTADNLDQNLLVLDSTTYSELSDDSNIES